MTLLAEIVEDALCAQVDTELFFPVPGERAVDARRVCAACPVREPCLEYAIRTGVTGIWGGTGRRERLEMGAAPVVSVPEPVYGCGTEAGAKRHLRAGEPVCVECRAAATTAARYRARARTAREVA